MIDAASGGALGDMTPADAILPPQGHWIEDSKKIGPKMQEKALGFL